MENRFESIERVDIIIFLCFIASFLHSSTYLLFLIVIALLAVKNEFGCIKGMIWISLRTIINYNIATQGNGVVQIVKWLVIFELSFIIVFSCKKGIIHWKKVAISHIAVRIMVLMGYILVQSILFSGYPVASIFKMISYGVVFLAAINGVAVEAYNGMWSRYLFVCLKIVMVLSIIIFPVKEISFSSAELFQGITNQSNMFGVIACVFFSLFYYNLYMKKCTRLDMILAGIVAIFLVLSQSRNGVLGVIILTMIYMLISDYSIRTKVTTIIALIVIMSIIWVSSQEVRNAVLQFVYKSEDLNAIMSGKRDLFSSRQIQKDLFNLKFSTNRWFGTGFGVPYNDRGQDWGFYLSLITEPGNIGYAVLGDLGIIGSILFIRVYTCIFKFRISKGSIILFCAPFLVSLGEMVFFSTNNMAMLLYIIFGLVINEGEQ